MSALQSGQLVQANWDTYVSRPGVGQEPQSLKESIKDLVIAVKKGDVGIYISTEDMYRGAPMQHVLVLVSGHGMCRCPAMLFTGVQ